jgi:L-alanine-DL-glutamate epimerase-like enolase superfamily enzyme
MGMEMTSAVIALETIIVDLPTIRPHKLAMHSTQNQTLVMIRVRCSNGVEGIGESTTIGGFSYGIENTESIKTNQVAASLAHRQFVRKLQRVRCRQRSGAPRSAEVAAVVSVHGHRSHRHVPSPIISSRRRP